MDPLAFRRRPEIHPDASRAAWDPRREFASLSKALLHTTAEVMHTELEANAVVLRYCEALTAASTHLPLAWSWFGPSDTAEIRPQVYAGRAAGWGEQLVIERNWLTNKGPSFGALAGRRSAPFSISRLAPWGPWRVAAREHGIRSVLCLPLRAVGDQQSGVFVAYADRDDYFDASTVEFFESISNMFGAILARASANRALRRAVMTDALTGLGNRHALDALTREIGRHQAHQPPVVVAMVDLDRFKSVNDNHGHAVGDQVLKNAAATLRHAVRLSDEVLRLGGEEFLLCLRGTSLARGVEIAQSVCDALRQVPHPLGDGQILHVTGSVGVAHIAADESLTEAIQRADAALYAAKHAGRDRVCVA